MRDGAVDVAMGAMSSNHLGEQILITQRFPGFQGRWSRQFCRRNLVTCPTKFLGNYPDYKGSTHSLQM